MVNTTKTVQHHSSQFPKKMMRSVRQLSVVGLRFAKVSAVVARPCVAMQFRGFAGNVVPAKKNLAEVLSNELVEESNEEIDQEFVDIKAQIEKTFKIKDEVGLGEFFCLSELIIDSHLISFSFCRRCYIDYHQRF